MKRKLLNGLLLILSMTVLVACDDDDNKTISAKDLPIEAQEFVKQHFPETTYRHVEKDDKADENGGIYDVDLNNGFEIEFDTNGNWVEVDGNKQALPQSIINLIPKNITNYITDRYPTLFIENIERKANGYYEIELNNDLELLFTNEGVLAGLSGNGNSGQNIYPPANLPEAATAFINTHFKEATILRVEKDNTPDENGSIYEVSLNNGFEVEFDAKGVWVEIDSYWKAMPQSILALLPEGIPAYVNTNMPNLSIVGIEKQANGYYEIELSNDLELIFDAEGKHGFLMVDKL